VIAQIIVGGGEGSLGSLLVHRNHTDRVVIPIFRPGSHAGDDGRINAREVVIIVSPLWNRGAIGTSRQRVNRSIFLYEAGVGSSTGAHRPLVIVEADGPEELRVSGGGEDR